MNIFSRSERIEKIIEQLPETYGDDLAEIKKRVARCVVRKYPFKPLPQAHFYEAVKEALRRYFPYDEGTLLRLTDEFARDPIVIGEMMRLQECDLRTMTDFTQQELIESLLEGVERIIEDDDDEYRQARKEARTKRMREELRKDDSKTVMFAAQLIHKYMGWKF